MKVLHILLFVLFILYFGPFNITLIPKPIHFIYVPWKISSDVSDDIGQYEMRSLKELSLPMLRFIKNNFYKYVSIQFVTRVELVDKL